jgi:putative heme transporter
VTDIEFREPAAPPDASSRSNAASEAGANPGAAPFDGSSGRDRGTGSAVSGPGDELDDQPTRTRSRRPLFSGIKVIIAVVIVYYLVLPNLAKGRSAWRTLANVNLALILLGFGLQAIALLCYSQLTRAALPHGAIKLGALFRIQLATKAVGNVTIGGAASSALGYRLMTVAGVAGTDAGFALGVAGLGSAVVLNLLLWTALLVSIPLSGVNPLYVTASLLGVLVMVIFAGLVFALLRGQELAERVLRRLASRVTFMDEDRTASVVQQLAQRLRQIVAAPALLRRVAFWAVANWMLDAASLWVFLRAYGGSLRVDSLLVAFCLANVLAVIPLTPGGLGIVDGVYTPLLVGFGLSAATVTVGVPSYRFAQFWLPIPLGALMYLTLRLGPWRIVPSGLGRLRDAAKEARESPDPVFGRPADTKSPVVAPAGITADRRAAGPRAPSA